MAHPARLHSSRQRLGAGRPAPQLAGDFIVVGLVQAIVAWLETGQPESLDALIDQAVVLVRASIAAR